jgi:diguanylate cyclase (GGDEF)-like protein
VLARRWGELSATLRNIRIPLTDETSVLVHAIRTGETLTTASLAKLPQLKFHAALQQHFPLKNFAAAPLLADQEAIGVIVADSTTRPRDFNPEQITVLEMFANQAALAINNGLIFQNVLDRAQRDSLTRLYNHGHFQEVLRSEIDRAQRYGNPLSLIMLDIDHFKRFNDTWGHQTGDKVLKQTALLLSALVRVSDLPARYGGEEFALLLPHTPYEAALELAERLRVGVERKVNVTGPKGEKVNVTSSFGVATFPRHADSAAGLIAIADEALYSAKEAGRNRVVGADEAGIEEETESGEKARKGTKRTSKKRRFHIFKVKSSVIDPGHNKKKPRRSGKLDK